MNMSCDRKMFTQRPSAVATCVAALVISVALAAAAVNGGTTDDFDRHRKILVSPTVNTPEPFQGFGGWCGWPDSSS